MIMAEVVSRRDSIRLLAVGIALCLKPSALLAEPPMNKKTKITTPPLSKLNVGPLKSKKIPDLVKGITGTDEEKVHKIFDKFEVGEGILKYSKRVGEADQDNYPPRTVDETIEKGGDCSDLALVIIAAMNQVGLKCEYGIASIHFSDSPEDEYHAFAYYINGAGKPIIVDPQTAAVGNLEAGRKHIVDITAPASKAAWMYYREFGDYYSVKGAR